MGALAGLATGVVRGERAGTSPVDAWIDEHVQRWHETLALRPQLGPQTGWRRQWANARAARRLIDGLGREAERVPPEEPARQAWRESVRGRLQSFGETRLGWPDGYRRLVLGDAFFESAADFTRRARALDPKLKLQDLGQALRNVWIGNSLQMLLGQRVELRSGLFAYSMLYPVTDNWLDDPSVAPEAKRAFNARFERRLAGEAVTARRDPEAAAFRLVAMIEDELPRARHTRVYASLLEIQRAQSRSVKQHDARRLGDRWLLTTSVWKGGSSVLADLDLVAPAATAAQRCFAFGYGVFLQLLDDLQDVEDDLARSHETLFTRAARRGPLDEAAARLARFMDGVLENSPVASGEHDDRVDLIRRNCRALLVGCVAEMPRRFTRAFRRGVESEWPLTLRAQRSLRARAGKRWVGILARTGEEALLRALCEAGPRPSLS